MNLVLCNCFKGQMGTRVTLKDQVEYTPTVELRTSNMAGLNASKDKDHHCIRGPLHIPVLGPHGDQSKGRNVVLLQLYERRKFVGDVQRTEGWDMHKRTVMKLY